MGTRSAAIGQGLAQVQTGVGTFIAYSTQPGNVALDGEGRNSPFTAALTKGLSLPDRNLTAVMIEVRRDVLAATAGKQVPWDHSALTGDFYFQLASAPGMLPKTAPAAPQADTEGLQDRIKRLEEELKRRPDPQLTMKLVELSQLKERKRQRDEADRQDQRAIAETYRKAGSKDDAQSRMAVNREVGDISMRMAERNSQRRVLLEQIDKIEKEVGSAAPAAEK